MSLEGCRMRRVVRGVYRTCLGCRAALNPPSLVADLAWVGSCSQSLQVRGKKDMSWATRPLPRLRSRGRSPRAVHCRTRRCSSGRYSGEMDTRSCFMRNMSVHLVFLRRSSSDGHLSRSMCPETLTCSVSGVYLVRGLLVTNLAAWRWTLFSVLISLGV